MAADSRPSATPAPPAAAQWIEASRSWAYSASARAGAPPPLTVLPSAPCSLNPAWRRAPSFAAAAALLVPAEAYFSGTVDFQQRPQQQQQRQRHLASPADLAAAAAVGLSAGLPGRLLWSLGGRGSFFVYSTPYNHCLGVRHRQHELLPLTLQLLQLLPHDGGAPAGSSAAAAAPAAPAADLESQQRQHACRIFHEIAADQRPVGLRLLGWLLSHLFRWLFNSEVYVDTASLQRLRALYEQQDSSSGGGSSSSGAGGGEGEGQGGEARLKASLVYIPAHKSHLDYLMLSYILFASELPCPHIAAGANLSLPLVGRLLRACGAFFIRRTSRGTPDAQLYKAVLAAYVHALLEAGHSLEFFIEGGRSRDGRVNPPKLGMLRMVVDALAAEGGVQRPVYLVPTAMNYDALLEEGSLAAQLAGAAKKSESLAGLASTCWGILAKAVRARWQRWALGLGAGGYCGRATVAFGQPISLQDWMEQQGGRQALQAGGGAPRRAVAELGEQVTAGIRAASVLPTAALLVGALFEARHLGLPAAGTAAVPAGTADAAAGGKGKAAAGASAKLATAATVAVAAAADGSAAPAAAALCNGHGVHAAKAQPLHAGASSCTGGTPLGRAVEGVGWLAAELEQRGAAVVRLPQGGHPVSSSLQQGEQEQQQQHELAEQEVQHQAQLLLHVAGMLPQCCNTTAAASSTGSGSAGSGQGSSCRSPEEQQQGSALRLERGTHAMLLQHSRLNQLLPWLAAEGLLVAALLAAGGGRAGGASVAEVLDSAAWLRCMLAPEIDTALGPNALRSLRDFEPVLQRLVGSGAVELQECGAGGGAAATMRLAHGGGSSQRAALLAAALLAPLLASYCEAARAMLGVLAASGLGGATAKELCSAAQARLLALAEAEAAEGGSSSSGSSSRPESGRAARLVVPSIALVQGAQRSLAALGVLVPAPVAADAAPGPAGLPNEVPPAAVVAAQAAAEAAAAAPEVERALEPAGPEAAAPAGEAEEGGFLQLAGKRSSSGDMSGSSGGAVDAEYAVDAAEPPTPAPTPVEGPGSGSTGGPPAALPPLHSGRPSRNSFERRRQQRRAAAAAAAAAAPKGGSGSGSGSSSRSRSRSGSDSELDPAVADSVAANLCRLDGSYAPGELANSSSGSPAGVALPAAAAAQAAAAVAATPTPADEAAAAGTAAAAGGRHSGHGGRTHHGTVGHWVLGQPEQAARQLADRLEDFICI